MTREGWREAVIEAMSRFDAGDDRFLNLIADLLANDDVECIADDVVVSAPAEDGDVRSLFEMQSVLDREIQRRVYGVKDRES